MVEDDATVGAGPRNADSAGQRNADSAGQREAASAGQREAASGAAAAEAEFDAFVRATSDTLHRTAYLLTGNRAGAQDAVQSGLTRVYLAWDRRAEWGNRIAYARRCVINVVLADRARAWSGELPTSDVADRVSSGDDAAAADDRDALRRALRALPARQRTAVVLRHYLDLSEAQTAAELDCALGTVKSLTARGLLALRAELEGTS